MVELDLPLQEGRCLALCLAHDFQREATRGRKCRHLSHTISESRTPMTENWEHTWHVLLSGVGNMWWEIFH